MQCPVGGPEPSGLVWFCSLVCVFVCVRETEEDLGQDDREVLDFHVTVCRKERDSEKAEVGVT